MGISNINGLVVDPEPQKIAEALDTLYENRKYTENLGKNAYEIAKDKFNLNKTKKQ